MNDGIRTSIFGEHPSLDLFQHSLWSVIDTLWEGRKVSRDDFVNWEGSPATASTGSVCEGW